MDQAAGRGHAPRAGCALARVLAGTLVGSLGMAAPLAALAEHAWEWRNPTPQGGTLECVAAGPEGWRALGQAATLLGADASATDWRAQAGHDLPRAHVCTAMAQGEGVWLAALEGWFDETRLLRSDDGTHWEAVREGAFHGLLHHQDGFVGVGEKPVETSPGVMERRGFVSTSRDGAHWDEDVVLAQRLRDVAAGAGGYVAVGAGGAVFTSPDARDWEAAAATATEAWLYSVAYGGERYVAVGADGTVVASADGDTWEAVESDTTRHLYRVRYAAGRFAAVGEGGVVLESTDGLTWAAQELPRGNTLYDLAVLDAAPQQGFVAVGAAGDIYTRGAEGPWTPRTRKLSGDEAPHRHLYGAAHGPAGVVAVGSAGALLHSPDGATWSARAVGTEADLWGVSADGPAYVAVGTGGVVLRSVDGVNWTRHSAGGDLAAVAHGVGGYVAVGAAGRVERSADGAAWETLPAVTDARLFDIAHGAPGYVAVGDDDTLLYSAEGAQWEPLSGGADGPVTRVAWGGGRYLALAPEAGRTAVLGSADGRLWQRLALLDADLGALTYDADRERFVAAGFEPLRDFFLYESADNAAWEEHPLPASHIHALSAGAGLIGVGRWERVIQAGGPAPAEQEEDEVGNPGHNPPDEEGDVGENPQNEAPAGGDVGDVVDGERTASGCAAGRGGRPDGTLLALLLGAGWYLVGARRRVARSRVRR